MALGFQGSVSVLRAFALLLLLSAPALAHDHSHPEQEAWYRELMQPDNPKMSCCGEADAYWADEVHVRNGKTYATVTDDRGVPGRPHVPVGTVIEVPNYKLKWDRGNPTGHNILFLSRGSYVYCFVQGTGI